MNTEYKILQQKAKDLGINSLGKKSHELEQAIQEAERGKSPVANSTTLEMATRTTSVPDSKQQASLQKAREEAALIRQARDKRGYDPAMRKLQLFYANKEPHYNYRWVNQDKVEQREYLGYSVVEGVEARPVGKGQKGVLMRIPTEIYAEDQKIKMNEISNKVASMEKGENPNRLKAFNSQLEESKKYNQNIQIQT